jgi:DNA-directed RNA polymerase subunit M/transcription elongation factor TFIIS
MLRTVEKACSSSPSNKKRRKSHSGSSGSDNNSNSSNSSGEEESSSGDDDPPPPVVVDNQQEPIAKGVRCFLCDYCTSQEVRFVTTFIADNVANMEIGFMAEQIRKYILEKRPEYSQPFVHGLETIAIKKHIRQHMLSPTVRIADMMRHLLKLCDTLRNNLEKVDPETGETMADRSNIDTYLKVVTKVLDMYKMSETNKMLFASTEK